MKPSDITGVPIELHPEPDHLTIIGYRKLKFVRLATRIVSIIWPNQFL